MSRHIPFQSLRQPEREVSQERLAEILARRGKQKEVSDERGLKQDTGGQADSGAVPDGARPEPGDTMGLRSDHRQSTLEWLKPVNHGGGSAMVFDTTRRFRIDILGSKVTAHYTCWKLAEDPRALNERLGMVYSADEARALCLEHKLKSE